MSSQIPVHTDRAKALAACAERFKCKADLYRYLEKQQVSTPPTRPPADIRLVLLPPAHPELPRGVPAANFPRGEDRADAAAGQAGAGALLARARAQVHLGAGAGAPGIPQLHARQLGPGLQAPGAALLLRSALHAGALLRAAAHQGVPRPASRGGREDQGQETPPRRPDL